MTRYTLTAPLTIGPRLMPSIEIDGLRISVQATAIESTTGRTHWHYAIDTPAGSYEARDLTLSPVRYAGDSTDWAVLAGEAIRMVADSLQEGCDYSETIDGFLQAGAWEAAEAIYDALDTPEDDDLD